MRLRSYEEEFPAAGWPSIIFGATAASVARQVHACQTMAMVQTVSIVAKNRYSGKAGGRPHPIRGGTKVRKPLTSVTMMPAMIFASRFARNGSSREARIIAIGYFHQDRRTREGQLPEVRSVRRWRANNRPQGNDIRIQVVEQREDPQYRQTLPGVVHLNLRVSELRWRAFRALRIMCLQVTSGVGRTTRILCIWSTAWKADQKPLRTSHNGSFFQQHSGAGRPGSPPNASRGYA